MDTKSANDHQVGGVHYFSSYAHWDMVVDFRLDYFRANATKYLTRHRKKNGLEDVDKSGHYVQKLIELIEQRRFNPLRLLPSGIQQAMYKMSIVYFQANKISEAADQGALMWLMAAQEIGDLKYSLVEIERIREQYARQPKPASPMKLETAGSGVAGPPPILTSHSGGIYTPGAQFTREGYRGTMDCWQCRKCFAHFELPLDTNPESAHVCGGGEATPAYVDQAKDGTR